MKTTVVAKANPNRHGWVKLIRYDECPDYCDASTMWAVKEPDMEDDFEYVKEEHARRHYDEVVARLSEEPNWEAQAAYDEEHVTINGYAPWQYNREY